MQDQISRSSRSASPIHSSTEQKTIFVNNYSNVRVVRSITRFDGARLSYALVRSNCNKLVITWPLGRLANLSPSGASRPRVINQPAPSWPCYNYYLSHDDVIHQRHRPGGKSRTNPAVRAGKVTSAPNTSIYGYIN